MRDVAAGYLEGERIAKLSVWTLALLGVIEIVAAQLSGSIGLAADGIDSMSDAIVSFLVYLGLKMSRKAPDERFHFGYYKIESLVAFSTSVGLMVVGGAILYRSYLAFLSPEPLRLPLLALAVLLVAGSVSLYRAFQMRKIAKRYSILSLKLDANNAIKDGSASFLVFFTVLTSTLGFHYMDAVGGMAVGFFIISVSYVVIKEAALVLLDAYHNPDLVDEIKRIVENVHKARVVDILLRATGPYVQSEIHLEVDSEMTVGELDGMKASIEQSVREKFTDIQRVVISARTKSS